MCKALGLEVSWLGRNYRYFIAIATLELDMQSVGHDVCFTDAFVPLERALKVGRQNIAGAQRYKENM